MDSVREIELVFKLILAIIFGGMSFLFWAVNREDDAQRLERMKELDLLNQANQVGPKNLTPLRKLQLDFSALFELSEDPKQRGELLEDAFNRIFSLGDVSVACPFERRTTDSGQKLDCQLDGVIELDTILYLVEIRWEESALAAVEIQNHLELLCSSEEGSPRRGVIVSFNGFTDQAILAAKKALKAGHIVILCTMSDITHILAGEGRVDAFLHTRISAATIDKNPYASYSDVATMIEEEFI